MAAGRSKQRDVDDDRVKQATFADYEALKENLASLTSERSSLQSQISGLAAENKSLLGMTNNRNYNAIDLAWLIDRVSHTHTGGSSLPGDQYKVQRLMDELDRTQRDLRDVKARYEDLQKRYDSMQRERSSYISAAVDPSR